MAHSNILVICEGVSEKDVYSKMSSLFIGDSCCKCYEFKTNLYILCDKLIENGLGTDIKKDEFDIITILKSLATTKEQLGILSNKYESILLCFDIEFQAEQYDEQKLLLMIDTFDNDTEQGQLILNYPMMESLYDHKNTWESYKDREVDFEGLTSATYCGIISKRGLKSPAKNKCVFYTRDQFYTVLNLNIKKACYLLNLQNIKSTNDFLLNASQKHLLLCIRNHLTESNKIWVLNTSIYFLLDYLKFDIVKEYFTIN